MKLSKFLFATILGKRLPKLNGEIQVEGSESQIAIARDEWGIPYIKADSIRDAWFGLGFCQGQDRSFQLELAQRLSRGTLSEIIGSKTISADRLSRQIGFHRSSESQFPKLDSATKQYMRPFCEGVNQGRANGTHNKAHEFTLLKCEPSVFTPEDTLSTLKLFAFQMGSNWDSELTRLQILLGDGEPALKDLDPEYSQCHPLSTTLYHQSQLYKVYCQR
jgi:penicillin amidase